MLHKGKKAATTPSLPTKQAQQSKPLPDEESSSDDDSAQEQELDDDEGDSSSGESEDVTEEALERMMNLLGDVDAEELGLVDGEEEEGDEDDDEVLMQSDDEEEEQVDEEEPYENLSADEDGDIVPVERTTVNDKVGRRRSFLFGVEARASSHLRPDTGRPRACTRLVQVEYDLL